MKKYEMKITFMDEDLEELIWTGVKPVDDLEVTSFPITLKTIYEYCKFMEECGDWSAPYPQVELKEIELDYRDKLRPAQLLEEEMNMRGNNG